MAKEFGVVVAPLHELTGKVPFKWEGRHQAAFEAVKRALAGITEMAVPDTRREFVLSVDASTTGIGGVVQRWRDGRLWPVVFWKRPFSGLPTSTSWRCWPRWSR
jgi:hypothetical protein